MKTKTIKPTDDMIKWKADMDRADHDKERAEIQYNAACERAEKGQ